MPPIAGLADQDLSSVRACVRPCPSSSQQIILLEMEGKVVLRDRGVSVVPPVQVLETPDEF